MIYRIFVFPPVPLVPKFKNITNFSTSVTFDINVFTPTSAFGNPHSFAACTNDGITNEGGEETSGTVSETDMFIGTWSGHGEWTFNADGTCMYEYFDQYEGHWTYDSESRTLITDVLEWNWKIINVSENMWTGEHLAGSKDTYTYSRVEI